MYAKRYTIRFIKDMHKITLLNNFFFMFNLGIGLVEYMVGNKVNNIY